MVRTLIYEEIEDYINNKDTGNGCILLATKEEFEQEKIKQNKSSSQISF